MPHIGYQLHTKTYSRAREKVTRRIMHLGNKVTEVTLKQWLHCQVCQALTKPPRIVCTCITSYRPQARRLFWLGPCIVVVSQRSFPVYLYAFLCYNAAIGPHLSTLWRQRCVSPIQCCDWPICMIRCCHICIRQSAILTVILSCETVLLLSIVVRSITFCRELARVRRGCSLEEYWEWSGRFGPGLLEGNNGGV